jgi:signal transduction histidine kinase
METAIDTPIIFVTANQGDFPMGDLKLAGALDVVGKPVNMAALHRSMNESLQERQKEAEHERERRVEVEQDLHEATMTKLFLIGDMAHRVNNPLNVALGGVTVTQSAVGDFVKMVLGFFSEPEERSPEENQVIEKVDMLVSQIDTAMKNTERAIGRATDYIADLRVMGGVDGESPEEVGLKGVLLKALIRLENDLGWPALERIRGRDAIEEMTVMGQTATLSVAIATWLKHVLLRSKDEDSVPIRAELSESGDHLWFWARLEEGRAFKGHYVEDLSAQDLVMGLLARHGGGWCEETGPDGRVVGIGMRMAATKQGWKSNPK